MEYLLLRGKASARKLSRARSLLNADEGLTDDEIASGLNVSVARIERTRQRFVEANLEALNERPRPGGQRKLSGKQEAPLIAIAWTPAPNGQPHWTLRLLADTVVELGLAPSIARETVRQVLKKTPSSPGNISNGVCRR